MIDPVGATPLLDVDPAGLSAGFRALARFFDRIVVITLRRATGRHAQLARNLDGLPHELVFGTDCKTLDLEALAARGLYDPARARAVDRYRRSMTAGQVACALSHAAVWEEVAGGPHERVLIFEDDVLPHPAGLAAVGETLASLPATWGLLYLGYSRNEVVTARARLNRLAYMALGAVGLHYLSAREASNLLPRPFAPRLRRAGHHDQAVAYGLTPAAAERLLRFQRPIVAPADTAMTRVILRGEIEAYVAEPRAFFQHGIQSYIRGLGVDGE